MEKQSRKQSSKHGNSGSKTNTKTNKNLYLSKIREAKKSLDEKYKEIIVPIMKIQKKLNLKFDIFTKDYNEIIKKAETANKEIITHLEENKNDSMNITDIQLNQKYAISHENMIKFYEKVADKLELFTNLINSNEYNNLIKEFDKIISEKDIVNEKEDGKEILENFEKNCLILKKNSKKIKKTKLIGTNTKKILKKNQNGKETEKKNKKQESKDLLDILQNEYKDNSYIQKISKTFYKRRLFKHVIYINNFEYKEDGTFEEKKIKSSGESTIYKYGKFTFKFKNDEFNQEIFDKLVKYVGEDLKQCFTKIDEENKEYIIGGKLGSLIYEFLNKIIRKNLFNEFNIIKACIEFYEFYEELINEFNDKESNVKIINCDEKIYNNLKKDWESLQLVRDFVNKNKKKISVENNINDNKNDENNNNDNKYNNDNANNEQTI